MSAQEVVTKMAVKPEKKAAVSDLKDRLQRAQSVVLTNYRGLKVADANRLRRTLQQAGVEYRVAKNTLIRIAAHDLGLQGLDPYLEGPTALVISYDDPVAPAKHLTEFAKKTKDVFELKAGVLEGQVIDAEGVKDLAATPPKEELIAKLMGSIQSPLVGLVSVLQGNVRELVYALNAIAQKQEEAAG